MLSFTPRGIAEPWITTGPGPGPLGLCSGVSRGCSCGSTTTWPTPGAGCSAVRQKRPVVTGQRQLTNTPAPPRRPGVERGTHHPGPGADGGGPSATTARPGRTPRPPGPRPVAAARARGHRPQARLPAGTEELGELRLFAAHNPLTHEAPRFAYRVWDSRPSQGAAVLGPGTVTSGVGWADDGGGAYLREVT